MDKVKFRCPSCSKGLSIGAQHAGKVVACPGCSTKLKIPGPDAEALTSNLPPGDQTDPSQDPLGIGSLPSAPVPNHQTSAPINPFADSHDNGTPTNPLSSPELGDLPASPQFPAPNSLPASGYGIPPDHSTTPPTETGSVISKSNESSFGKSFAGLAVAAVVAGVFTVVWLIVAAVAEGEFGILAWAMGGAVGVVAGIIGRNPSTMYCGLTAGIAVLSVIAAKVIMAAAMTALSWGADMMVDFAGMSPERQKYVHAMAEKMIEDGELEGLEKQYAEISAAAFFSGTYDAYDEMDEEMFEISMDVDKKIRDTLDAKTEEEQEEILAAARARHPEWIEDHNHYIAVVAKLLDEESALSEELAAHAKNELAEIDGQWDQTYFESVAPIEMRQRNVALRTIAAERLNNMDDQQRDEMVRSALRQHLNWSPFPDARAALVEKLQREGAFTGPLEAHAKETIKMELTDEYPDYFEDTTYEVIEARDKELNAAVNEQLVSMDAASREALIAETATRYPDWYRESASEDEAQEEMEEAQQELEDALDEMGTDGSFLGNLATVFSFFDLLWLFLGASTAYGTAQKYGAQ